MNKIMPFIMPLFRSVLFIIVGLLFAAITNESLEQASRWWSIICTICNIITIIVLFLICKKEKTTYAQLINFNKDRVNIRYTLGIIILMILLGMGGLYGFGFLIYGFVPVTMIQPIPIWISILNVILLPITVVFAEMPLYFGYSLNRIEKSTRNKYLSIFYPMFFYALQHSFFPLIFDWKHLLFRFMSFLPLMIVLGIIYYKRRRLVSFMVGHSILDLATGAQILVTSISPTIFDMMNNISNKI